MVDPSPPADATYRWTTACFTNDRHTDYTCFPYGQTAQSVTGSNVLAEDAGSVACSVAISGTFYGSDYFTLRVSGMYAHPCSTFMLYSCTWIVYMYTLV